MGKKYKTDLKISIPDNEVWTFNKNVTKNFEDHILKSVPGYLDGHNLIISISRDVLTNKSKVLDIGCSTGTLLKKLNTELNLDTELYGIDISKEMINEAKKRCRANKIKFYNQSVNDLRGKGFDLILSYFTLQFVHPSKKIKYLKSVYDKLNDNCYFIIFEKISEKSGFMQNLTTMAYNDFKIINNFKSSEIFNKTHTLRGAMHSVTREENFKNFKKCKFRNINLIFKNLFFEGYIMKK